jgi:hypothetical protein
MALGILFSTGFSAVFIYLTWILPLVFKKKVDLKDWKEQAPRAIPFAVDIAWFFNPRRYVVLVHISHSV